MWVDRDLEQVEQVPRALTATNSAGANNANMIRRRIHLRLRRARSVELRKVNMPARAWIEIRSRVRTIIDNINSVIICGDPWEDRRKCRRSTDCNRRAPSVALIFRAAERH